MNLGVRTSDDESAIGRERERERERGLSKKKFLPLQSQHEVKLWGICWAVGLSYEEHLQQRPNNFEQVEE